MKLFKLLQGQTSQLAEQLTEELEFMRVIKQEEE